MHTGWSKLARRTIIVPDPGGLQKHSLLIAGHRTSISLENVFWAALRDLAQARGSSIAALVAEIDAERGSANLSSAIRIHLFESRAAIPNSQ